MASVYSGTIVFVLTLGGMALMRVLAEISVHWATNVVLGGVFLFFGLSASQQGTTPLPLSLTPFGMPRCMQYVSADIGTLLSTVGGQASLAVAIPNAPAFVGIEFFLAKRVKAREFLVVAVVLLRHLRRCLAHHGKVLLHVTNAGELLRHTIRVQPH